MDLPGKKEAIIKQLLANNVYHWAPGANIAYVGWLKTSLREKQKEASVVVEFTSPEAANSAIANKTLWNSQSLQTVFYNQAARTKQCYKCQKIGHIGIQCQADQSTCGHCAKEHDTRECPKRSGGDVTIQCANCGGAHPAWSRNCEHMKKELERVQRIRMGSPRWHRESARNLSNPPSSDSSDGETDGAVPASSSGGSGSAPGPSSAGSQVLASASQPVDGDAVMAEAPASAPQVIGKRGPGRPRSNKSIKGSAPKVPAPRRQREEVEEHADFRARLNDGSPIKRTREPVEAVEAPEAGMVLRSSQLNVSGAARAVEHAEQQQEEELPTNPNNALSRVSVNIRERALGDAGLFWLPHNQQINDDDIFGGGPGPITSSAQGLDSDPDFNPAGQNDL